MLAVKTQTENAPLSHVSKHISKLNSLTRLVLLGWVVVCFLVSTFLNSNHLSGRVIRDGIENMSNSDMLVSLTGRPRSSWLSHPLEEHVFSESGNQGNQPKRKLSRALKMSNFFNKMYTGEVKIGGQRFRHVVFDTGSRDLWVLSAGHDKSIPDYDFLDYYDHRKSQDYKPGGDWSIQYGSGRAEGMRGTDTVTIAGLTVRNQPFSEAITTVGMEIDRQEPQNGICGFGRHENSVPTLMFTLYTAGLNPSGMFSFYLTSHGFDGSTLVLGNDPTLLGYFQKDDAEKHEIKIVESSYSGFWSVKVHSFKIGHSVGKNGDENSDEDDDSVTTMDDIHAIFDTGTTYIGIPEQYFLSVMNEITKYRTDCQMEEAKKHTSHVYMCTDSLNPLHRLPVVSIYLHKNGKNSNDDGSLSSPFSYFDPQRGMVEKKHESQQRKEKKSNNAKSNNDDIIEFLIHPEHYIDDDGQLAFQQVSGGLWILGDTFLTGHFVSFDEMNQRVIITESSHEIDFLPSVIRSAGILLLLTWTCLCWLFVCRCCCCGSGSQSANGYHAVKHDVPLN